MKAYEWCLESDPTRNSGIDENLAGWKANIARENEEVIVCETTILLAVD